MHVPAAETLQLFQGLLFCREDQGVDRIRAGSGEFKKSPLVSSLLQDLDTKELKCKRCEVVQLDHSLRFFVLNSHTEVFKCQSPRCMFPLRNFIFRDRRDQSYYTYKRTELCERPPAVEADPEDPQTIEAMFEELFSGDTSQQSAYPELTATDPPFQSPPHTESESPSNGHGQANIEAILDELFPSHQLPVVVAAVNAAAAPCDSKEGFEPIPLPKLPPKLSRSLYMVSARKRTATASTSTSTTLPKNIKSPLDLVKVLLQHKTAATGEEMKPDVASMEESLSEAENQLKQQLTSVLNRPISPAKRAPVILKRSSTLLSSTMHSDSDSQSDRGGCSSPRRPKTNRRKSVLVNQARTNNRSRSQGGGGASGKSDA